MAVTQLNINNDMLDLKFESYKLSLDPMPVLKQSVVDGVEDMVLSNEEYSYLHIRMSSLLNHLFQDQWNPNCVFYINKNHCIYWTTLSQNGRLASPRMVWKFPEEECKVYANATIYFPSADWSILSNGSNSIYILHTPSREAGEPWNNCHCHTLTNGFQYYILHAAHRDTSNGHQIDCLITSAVPKSALTEKVEKPLNKNFAVLLEWISFACGQDLQSWAIKRNRRLRGSSVPEYAAIDHTSDAICVVSDSEYKMFFDSDKPMEESREKEVTAVVTSLYAYVQTSKCITVFFRLPEDTKEYDVQVTFLPSYIEILIQGQSVLKGHLTNCIVTSNCKWNLKEQRLEMFLEKADCDLMWPKLIKDDVRGEELADSKLVDDIHMHLAYLTSDAETTQNNDIHFNLEQLEECDISNELLIFQRIDGNSHVETHRVNMSGHQWLFMQHTCPESLPAICLRHDVDGILWQPKNVCSEGELEPFKMEHIATFNALGYVQASKQDKRFILCSPDFHYSVISDCSRHVYIYSQPENLHSALELRNRKTGEAISHIAKQYVVSLENCDKILGMQVCSQCVFVLSRQMLYAVKFFGK